MDKIVLLTLFSSFYDHFRGFNTNPLKLPKCNGFLFYAHHIQYNSYFPLPKNSKRNRRVRTRVPSDWHEYFGSNKQVQELVESKGQDNYKREILRLCKTKGEMSYYEAKLQFELDVLLREDYYNEFIGCKIHSRHIKG